MNKTYVNTSTDENISKYFKDIKQTNFLTSEKEVELAEKIKEGNQEALEELVTANLKFVITIAKEYQGQGIPLSDLISEGNCGLVKAATRFDPTRGFRFISYAVWWVRQAILQSLNDDSRTIRYPSNVINKIYQTKKELERFELENEREADYVDFMDDDSFVNIASLPKCSSLNHIITESGNELSELIEDKSIDTDDMFDETNTTINAELENILSQLDDREREIIECYFGLNKNYENMTLEVIGEKHNLTKERIRQIKEKALKKLRHNAENLFDIINA